MSHATFLKGFISTAAFGAALALVLYLLNTRWFSFYGPATTTLAIIIPLIWILTARYHSLGLRRWPLWVFAAAVAIPAIVQIAYWTVFFSNKDAAILLAIGRTMILEKTEAFLIWPALAIAAFGIWLVSRALVHD